MRSRLNLLCGLLLATSCWQAAAGRESPPIATPAEFMAICGACHLETGVGVPGAFPPLDARLARWAATEQGRHYLVAVISRGLFGSISVDGVQYVGAMPPMNHLESTQVAGLLNYVLLEFADADESRVFSATEVARVREETADVESASLRPAEPVTELPGVTNAARARSNYMLNCEGCHGHDGAGNAAADVPRMKNFVASFLKVSDGREFIVQVPGTANAALDDAQLAELLNWLLPAISPAQMPDGFQPYSEQEVARLRREPEIDVLGRRARLISAMQQEGLTPE